MPRERFDHQAIEKSAQEKWEASKLYETDLEKAKDPYYLLFEFPYPSGDLHIGHWYAFALTDIFARLQRMKGKDVLFPMGFDAFGLPAENAAMKYGKDPKAWTLQNMETMRAQVKTMGTSVDWSKEVVTCDPEYYRFTQWLFAKFVEAGMAERKQAPVKWCPKDQTVLANEQVVDGACERCGTDVEEKKLTQWFMKITKYAEQLIADLDPLPWREDIKEAQRQWIGKSEGAHLYFAISGTEERITVFTTRADTVFGATYVVLAPEHPLLASLAIANRSEVDAYIATTKKKTERERSENKEKTGVRLEGVSAINPATKEEIPVFIADYVLATYGTGAVMAVPAHDERDFEFAQRFNLPIRTVIEPKFVADPKGDAGLKEGQEIIRREAICAVVRNPKNDTYLCNSWKTVSMNGLFTGGVDEGEDIVESARREVREETGYKNLKHISRPELSINTFFYHRVKQQNRWAHFRYVFFELENEEQDTVDEKESALHEIVWKKREELKDFFTVFEGDFVVDHLDGKPFYYPGDGILVNSGEFSTKNNREVIKEIVAFCGREMTTNYRIRDWLVSRQRYWGCPIPMVYDPEGNPHYVGDENLPWLLPDDVDFKPTAATESGEINGAPLASSKELKERVTKIFGKGWTPEYDTLDTFVDSSWYFYRYLSPHNSERFSDSALLKKWLPVNRYSGGSEHTTMHLLYARFFHKALKDMGLVGGDEPFFERFNRGLILGPDGAKMSKSKGNVVNPDEYVRKYGADAVRMYLAFIGPYNEPGSYPFSLEGVDGMRKFLDRVDRLSEKVGDVPLSDAVNRALAKASEKVASDTERFKLNTAVSALMVLVNTLSDEQLIPASAYKDLVRMLAPYAPHLAEHLWERVGGEASVHTAPFPTADPSLLEQSEMTVVIQVNGKKRGEVQVATHATKEEVLASAKAVPAVLSALSGKSIIREIYVPGRLVSLVTG